MTEKDWIPLAERKPEKEGDYLAFSHNFGEHICAWRGGRFDSFPQALIASLVTHWMPLPPPPEPPDPFETWWNKLPKQVYGDTSNLAEVSPGCWAGKDSARFIWNAAVNTTKPNQETTGMRDTWKEDYPGRCDICGKETPLSQIHPGVQFGWKVGYVCENCSPTATKKV